jgi:hypothetical protein
VAIIGAGLTGLHTLALSLDCGLRVSEHLEAA